MYQRISLFATVGEGTLAPWDPPPQARSWGRLPVRAKPYDQRGPLHPIGRSDPLGSLPLLVWFLIGFAVNTIYIPLTEEKGLERCFGGEYPAYKRNVPRWIPRLRPWTPPGLGDPRRDHPE
jgi:hypothetical protein